MKNSRKLFIAIAAISTVLFFSACEENNVQPKGDEYGILPQRFKVDVPSSISSKQKSTAKSTTLKSAEADTLNGNEIYENLANFIAIGEGAADVVESIIWHIKIYNIENVIDLTYTSDEDTREKHLTVTSDVEYRGKVWEYQLTITDKESEGNEDGGKGMQVFWNNDPVSGIALIKPYNLNRKDDGNLVDAMFSIEYSEEGMGDYEAYMIVEIAELPLPNANWDPFAVDNLKMFVGKDGDLIDVYGNSNHPNAKFFTDNTGFNWAFVASGHEEKDIAVAEVGLPASSLDTPLREILLKEYSIKNVLTDEINQWFLDEFGIRPHEDDLANYLRNADAPGYFDKSGFIQGGTSPGTEYNELNNRLNALSPYNPKEISELEIIFK